ncbi:MAG: peptidase M1 [Flavobacteriaceae bacterium]|nr:peptidase M1 [Flavobacteriaceae bacterium]|tara:strand:+ start:17332 stop:18966 length:1635 start_codon:yes stop_codon:yes gene_type:complete
MIKFIYNLIFYLLLLSSYSNLSYSQDYNFTKQDTLRGSITPERSWWDLAYYHLNISVKPDEKKLIGSNTITYNVIKSSKKMQIDLQPPLKITKIEQNGKLLNFESIGNAHFVQLVDNQIKGSTNSIKVYYEGKPKEAIRAPWDGGLSWKRDSNGKHFIATSCQGIGASIWWPNKDHMYDEVDSMLISVNVPKDLVNVSNGRLRKVEDFENTKTFHWFVSNPINNYGVNINIGDYVSFSEIYEGEKGPLDMVYYVLRDNIERAKTHFKDAPKMMDAFEYWFGPYPFYEDSFKIVEVPYLGMEHQSSITYGNRYMKGYLGRDLSRTGWGLKFDYIIIHEAGHEWFANNITYKDIADMWIHESFTTYSENLFLDYHYGKEASSDYVIGTRFSISNKSPMIGPYGVNRRGSDIYTKGANVLHTLRQIANDDEKWRMILRGLNKKFYHQTVESKQIEDYISLNIGFDLSTFFNQYLRDIRIPNFEYRIEDGVLTYRWANVIEKFTMPLEIEALEKKIILYPETTKKSIKINSDKIKINRNYYVDSVKIN